MELKQMNIKPLHDKVLIKRVDEENKTAGGIIIPDTAKEKPSEGVVEAVGNGFRADDGKIVPMTVKAGDKVLFGKWAGTEIKVDGETRLIVKESDILAIIE
jgi:chaperonin GroES